MSGVSPNTIVNLRNPDHRGGGKNPRMVDIERLATALGFEFHTSLVPAKRTLTSWLYSIEEIK